MHRDKGTVACPRACAPVYGKLDTDLAAAMIEASTPSRRRDQAKGMSRMPEPES